MSGPGRDSSGAGTWSGSFVADALGVSVHSHPGSAVPVADLVGLALRRNPKRAHLLVSQVLAKHVPTEPGLVMAAGELLGAFVADRIEALKHDAGTFPPQPAASSAVPRLAEQARTAAVAQAAAQLSAVLREPPGLRQDSVAALATQVAALRTGVPDAVVIGYAETATGLGRLVANALGAYYIHSTRHATPGVAPVAGFEEGHSHATSHAMVPTDPHWLDGGGPVVLVDDEFSTGSTVINTIRELHALAPHSTYVVAALIDLRGAADRARFDALAHELGARISVTALGTGWIELGEDILDRAAALVAELAAEVAPAAAVTDAGPSGHAARPVASPPRAGRLSMLELSDSDAAPVRSDRFGNRCAPPETGIAAVAGHVAAHLAAAGCKGPVVVVGCEENMFLPLAVARELQALLPGEDVRFSTTTRSPIVPVDRPGYAIAGALTFASHDLTNDGPGTRFAYNLNGTGQRPGTLVVFPEPGTARRDVVRSSVPGLVPLGAAMAAAADDAVVVLLPADSPTAGAPVPVPAADPVHRHTAPPTQTEDAP